MKVEIQLTIEDIVRLSDYVLRHRMPVQWGAIWFIRIFFPLLIALLVARNVLTVSNLTVAFVVFLLWLLFMPPWFQKRHTSAMRKMYDNGTNALFEKRLFTFTPDGVEYASNAMNGAVRWGALVGIEKDAYAAYLFINKSQAYIVPKRVFENEAAFDAFYQAVADWYGAGKKTGAAQPASG